MRTSIKRMIPRALTLLVAGLAPVSTVSQAQIVTNWVAYNDHRPGPLIPPHIPVRTNWGTALRVTTYDMGAPNDTTGTLTNFLSGLPLPVTVTFTRQNTPNDYGTVSNFGPGTNTPAGLLFFGICDLSNNGLVGVDESDADVVTITFRNLNPEKRYVFRGTSARGGGYLDRWTVATINANGWIDAHVTGAGSPGVITSNGFPANLGAGQAAWNSGDNVEGDLVGWDFIAPAADGSFTLVCAQYTGPIPGGTTASGGYAYSFGAMLLAEVEASPPVVVQHPPTQTTVEQNRPFHLSVAATGTPLLYQWYKEGVGEIAGATFPTYSVAQAVLGDSGDYYAVVHNPLARATSTVAHVTVYADTNAPSVTASYAYPLFDAGTQVATLSEVTVEFNEPIEPVSATTAANYVLSGGGGNPATVTLTNAQTVILSYAVPLAEDTDYTITVSGVADVVGNIGGSIAAPFRTWMRGPGNGLLFEAYNTGPGVDVVALTSSPVYPDSPYLRSNLWAFESRLVFPDNTVDNYGSRIRGVFIPSVSGNWTFFLRCYDRGEVHLNSNGLDPAGKVLLVAETTGNEPRDWNKFASSPIPLRGGRGYYIEALHKAEANSNGDAIKVAARLAGTGLPTTGVPINDFDTNALAGPILGSPLAPRDLGGPLTIVQDVQDVTVEEFHVVTLSLGLGNPSGLPLFYQWFRDGVEIPGANAPTYSLQCTQDMSGSTFRVRVAKAGSVVTSRAAVLTVVPDVTAPQATNAACSYANLSVIRVSFNEFMQPTEVQDTFNWSVEVAGVPVSAVTNAVLEADNRTVTLSLESPLTLESTYDLKVSGGLDLAGNSLSPSPAVLPFVAGAGLPRLSITRAGNQVEISWPVPPDVFVLEEANAIVLPPDTMTWSTVTTAPVVANGTNTVTLTLGTGNKLFRLRL